MKVDEVHQKTGSANFVTDYDVRIQDYLISTLSDIILGCSFFGEEETAGNRQSVGTGYTFFIDPIDGTTNFMFDYKTSCVSVGLSDNDAMVAGWIYKAFHESVLECSKRSRSVVERKKDKCVIERGLNAGICAFEAVRYSEDDDIFDILPELFKRSLSIRNDGSAAIDLCLIAICSNVVMLKCSYSPMIMPQRV